jgi:hypothetical protein
MVSLPPGWFLLAWDAIDQPADGVGDHILPTVATPQHPADVKVPVPLRSGVSIVSVTLYVSAVNGGAVGQVEARVGVQVAPADS